MIVPVIKPRKDLKDKVLKKIEEFPASLIWWDQRYTGMLDALLEQFHEIIDETITLIENYDNVKKYAQKLKYSSK